MFSHEVCIYTFMHCIALHYITFHYMALALALALALHYLPYHTDVTPLKHHRFSQVPVTRSAQVTFVQAGRGEDSLRVRWCRFLKCCRTPPVGRWFPSSTSSRKRCVARSQLPSDVQATSKLHPVYEQYELHLLTTCPAGCLASSSIPSKGGP